MNKEKLENIIESTGSDEVRTLAKAELQKIDLQEKAAKGDDLSKSLLALKDMIDKMQPSSGGSGVSKKEVEEMLRGVLRTNKISFDDLDAELRTKLAGQVKVMLTLNLPDSTSVIKSKTMLYQFERPLFQTILSDWKARNNIYLFGGAGTGKTYTAGMIAKFLGYELVELNCNQFTSPLDIIGGQTIEGYQKGKLEMAWTNLNENDEPMKGAVMLLDELPKLDPNTAGLLNSALAKVKDFDGTEAPEIRNGKGDLISMKNILFLATGNTKLNEANVEYEANFKQDLSLQDRFAGSTYEVVVDYQNEFEVIMKGFAFIWLYLIKLRRLIIEESITGYAFVSIRIMQNMKDTYIVYRDVKAHKITNDLTLTDPKTIKKTLDSFLNLFTESQRARLMTGSDYNGFLEIVKEKNKLPLDALDTKSELDEAKKLIKEENKKQAKKIA